MVTSADIRKSFLGYFKKEGHKEIASSPVVPHDDPTLLFTNAGMNQFKDVFLGQSRREYTRATTSQKCIRSSGKHNDLENVGHTTRHLTFFEMLGNFSFGDYFKKEAIRFAWEVSTGVFKFPEERIWPTVFREDDEAFELWTAYVPSHRIIRLGEKDNFWAMGDTGPCGPCSELLFDRGEKYSSAKTPLEDATGERFLEFWNLVFMQYNTLPDGTREKLPKPSIDTGAGLERVMSLLLNTETVFETDILRALIGAIEKNSGVKYDPSAPNSAAFRVMADHVRSLSFAIADGAQPSNTDRGYALRKILRRAVRYARQLGIQEPFLASLLPALIEEMGESYPELISCRSRIEQVLTIEEEAFLRTLKRGGTMFTTILARSQQSKVLTGDDAFLLKDTYGLPFEEISLCAKDNNCSVDEVRFNELEEEAKARSRAARKNVNQLAEDSFYEKLLGEIGESVFTRHYPSIEATITACLKDGKMVSSLTAGEEGEILLNETPFYAEMGGQVGDTGSLQSKGALFQVQNTTSPFKGMVVHKGVVEKGTLSVGDHLTASINVERRRRIEANHTATHLLHWALSSVLGGHIRQSGSFVHEEYFRFDFAHHKQVTEEELEAVEAMVNRAIYADLPVKSYEISYEEAQNRKEIKQFFGEKYGNEVRVVEAGSSKELCGGTHTCSTGKLGFFLIRKESSIAAGIRRIEAVTQEQAYLLSKQTKARLKHIADKLKVPDSKLEERVDKLLVEGEALEHKVLLLKKEAFKRLANSCTITQTKVGAVYSLECSLDPADIKFLLDEIHATAKTYFAIVVGVTSEEKAHLAIRLMKAQGDLSAKTLLALGLEQLGGSGGGKETFAQGASPKKEALSSAMKAVVDRIAQ